MNSRIMELEINDLQGTQKFNLQILENNVIKQRLPQTVDFFGSSKRFFPHAPFSQKAVKTKEREKMFV